MTEETRLLIAEHELHLFDGHETSDLIDPATGSFAIKAKTKTLKAGGVHLVPAAIADELFTQAAQEIARGVPPCVRELTEREVLSWKQSQGLLIEKPAA